PGDHGGFGAAVALADLDGDSQPDLIAAAPDDGGGTIYVLLSKDRTGAMSNKVSSVIRRITPVSEPAGRLGSTLSTAPAPIGFGDSIVSGTQGVAEKLFLISGSSLLSHPGQATSGDNPHLAATTYPNQDRP